VRKQRHTRGSAAERETCELGPKSARRVLELSALAIKVSSQWVSADGRVSGVEQVTGLRLGCGV